MWIFIKKNFIVIYFLFFDLVLDNFDVESFKIFLDFLNDIFLWLYCLVWVRWNFYRGYFFKKMFIMIMIDNIIFNILSLISILIYIFRLFVFNIVRWIFYNYNLYLIEFKKCYFFYFLSWYNLYFVVWCICIVYRLVMFIM